MYRHALVELDDEGFPIDHLVEKAVAGLKFLADNRRGPHGLLRIVHPCESGADNSPRWDAFCPGGFDRDRWLEKKLELVDELTFNSYGSSVGNPGFEVYSVSFNALVAFNSAEIGRRFNNPEMLIASELTQALDECWSPDDATWLDLGPDGDVLSSVQVLDALFPCLVETRPERVDSAIPHLWSDDVFGAPYGPCSVGRSEATFDATAYWRGPSWPQLTYLLWLAMTVQERSDDALRREGRLRTSSVSSSFSEYLEPFSGSPLGAPPQTWAGLCIVPHRHLLRLWGGPGARGLTSIHRTAPRTN
jgi:hypothetical protein